MFSGADASQVGIWLGIFFGMAIGSLTIVWISRQLWMSFNLPPPLQKLSEDEYVTRHELSQAIDSLKAILEKCVGRAEYDIRNIDFEKRMTSMDSYIHQRFHDVMTGLSAIRTDIATSNLLLNREIGRREANDRIKDHGKDSE